MDAFDRDVRHFLRCGECGAFMVSAPPQQATWEQYEEGEFSDRIEELLTEPDYEKWDSFSGFLAGKQVLEVGPGTGHFLAAGRARGCEVKGVETSPRHRDYIRERWGIETVGAFSDISDRSVDSVFSFNCLEHIFDLEAHMRDVDRVLRPGGTFIISTCNGASLVPRMAGKWWSMFATVDHLSISTPKALRQLGVRSGMQVRKVWTSEYPLETPLSLAIALRNWRAARNQSQQAGNTPAPPTSGTRRLTHFVRRLNQNRLFAPIGNTIGYMGLAGSVKAVYQKPAVRP